MRGVAGVAYQSHKLVVGGSNPSPASQHFIALVTELVYVLVLEARFWEFESPLGHQIMEQKHQR